MVIIRTTYINIKTLCIAFTQCIYLFLIIAKNSDRISRFVYFMGIQSVSREVRTESFNIQMKQQISTSDSLILVRERLPTATKT
jgi:hypothetical protein